MRMVKIAGLALVGVVILVAAAFAFGVGAGWLVAPFSRQIEASTGYHLRIDGPARFVLRPLPALVVDDVGVADADHAAGQDEFFTAKRLRVELSLAALLKGEVRIGDVTIQHPVLRMDARRRPDPSIPQTQGSSASSSSGSRSADVEVRRVNIEDGLLLYRKPRGQTETVLHDVQLVASLPANRTLDVSVHAGWGSKQVLMSASSDGPLDLSDGRTVGVSAKIETMGSTQPAVTMGGKLSLIDQVLKFDNLKGTGGEDAFTGTAAIDFTSSKPQIRAALEFDRLRLDLGTASAGTGQKEGQAVSDAAWSDEPLDFTPLYLFNGDVRLSAGEMRVDKTRLGQAALQVKLDGGVLSAKLSQTRFYGGKAGGSFLLNVSGEQPRCAAQFELAGVNALPLLTDVADFDHLEGRFNAKFHLKATGDNLKGLVSTLGGDADFNLENGAIRGVNLAKMVRLLTTTTLEGWQENDIEKTSLDALGATFKIDGGVATTKDLRASGSRIRVSGAGTIDITAKQLDLKTDPKLILGGADQEASEDPLGFGVPVIVRGPWSNPQFYPDVANVLDHPAAAYAKLAQLGNGLFGLNKKQSNQSFDSLFDGVGSILGGFGRQSGSAGQASEAADPNPQEDPGPAVPPATKLAAKGEPPAPARLAPSVAPAQEEAAPVHQSGGTQKPGNNVHPNQRVAAVGTGGRVALVIGNGNYPDNNEPLTQPTKDAHAIADELRHSKFEVILGENLSKQGMRTAIDSFKGKVKPGSTALIFFSGFGIQADKQSYVIPVDAQIWTEPDVSRDGTSLEKILADLDSLGASTKIAIIDASRKNPYERRFRRYSAGLASIDAPTGTLVISAAAPGRVGVDERGSSSLFIGELLKEMRSPSLSAEEVFNRTRVDVSHASNNAQVPWVSSSLSDVFYFSRSDTASSDHETKEPSISQPAKNEPAKNDSSKGEPAKIESAKTEPAKTEPAKNEPAKSEPAKKEPAKKEPAKKEPPKNEPAKNEPAKNEPPKNDSSKIETETAKAEPSNNETDLSDGSSQDQGTSSSKAPSAETNEAIRKLDDEIKAHPGDGNAYYRRGQVYAENADYKRAVADFNEAVRLNPNDPEALNNRCWTRAVLGQLQAAVEDCNTALRLKPNYADALDSRGLVYLKLGRYRQAISDFDATLRVNPKQVSSLYGRGWAKLKTGDTTGGNADVKLAKALDPNIADEFAGYGVGP